MKKLLGVGLVLLSLWSVAAPASAAEFDDGQILTTRTDLAGKRVAFVPPNLSIDLTKLWYEALKRSSERWGYELIIRDPNWSVQAGAQAIDQLIAEKPDLLIVSPLDMQAYNRPLQRAREAGIPTIQVALKSFYNGNAYVGPNWYEVGYKAGEELVRLCGDGTGKSGKVALIQGSPTTVSSQLGTLGFEDAIVDHPEISIVANQAADFDATKAQSIATTILRQNADLCGIFGMWEVQDMGAAAAIRDAGRTADVYLVTEGGGNKQATCDNVENGNFAAVINYDARATGMALVSMVEQFLQLPPATAADTPTIGVYTELKTITPENVGSNLCWDYDAAVQYGL
jgi:ABC-type sugar transport system substrate-binding protein